MGILRIAALAVIASLVSTAVSGAQTTTPTPRRLMISVAQGVAADGAQRGAGVSTGPQVRVWDTRSADNVRVLQTVQALEGRSALVQLGQSVPVRERQVARSIVGGRVVEHVIEGGVDYRDANTGFLVVPRLTGDRVTLEISAQRQAFIPDARGSADVGRHPSVPDTRGGIDTQRVMTTVSGRLGEWIEVSSMSEERGSDREVLLGRAGGTRTESRSVLLKVDELR